MRTAKQQYIACYRLLREILNADHPNGRQINERLLLAACFPAAMEAARTSLSVRYHVDPLFKGDLPL